MEIIPDIQRVCVCVCESSRSLELVMSSKADTPPRRGPYGRPFGPRIGFMTLQNGDYLKQNQNDL